MGSPTAPSPMDPRLPAPWILGSQPHGFQATSPMDSRLTAHSPMDPRLLVPSPTDPRLTALLAHK